MKHIKFIVLFSALLLSSCEGESKGSGKTNYEKNDEQNEWISIKGIYLSFHDGVRYYGSSKIPGLVNIMHPHSKGSDSNFECEIRIDDNWLDFRRIRDGKVYAESRISRDHVFGFDLRKED